MRRTQTAPSVNIDFQWRSHAIFCFVLLFVCSDYTYIKEIKLIFSPENLVFIPSRKILTNLDPILVWLAHDVCV